jgi:hypothetical protein
VRKTIRLKPCH